MPPQVGVDMTIQEHNDQAVLQPEDELTIFEAAEFRDGLVMLGTKKITNVPPGVREQFEVIGRGKFLQDPIGSAVGEA
jgi:hypothetical protein